MVLYANTVYKILHNNKKMSKGVSGIVAARKYPSISRPQTEALKRQL